MASPDFPDPEPPPLLPPLDEVRNLDVLRQRRIRGATLLAGRRTQNQGSLGASITGGAAGGLSTPTAGGGSPNA
jgi:hypothetical protein